MKEINSDSKYAHAHSKRFKKTVQFLSQFDLLSSNILNLGPTNPLSELLRQEGYKITDTDRTLDLDLSYDIVKDVKFETVFAFEILEHLVSPFPILQSIQGTKLAISVPLSLWFAKAYWNDDDEYDRHYHEFEPRQIRMLLNKAGWTIKAEDMQNSELKSIGIRPILRTMYPRHYYAYCERQ